jgi:outer membrane protein assembly factor BamB
MVRFGRPGAPLVHAVCLAFLALGCSGGFDSGDFFGGTPRAYAGAGPVRMLWTHRITPTFEGPYSPVERAAAALDPSHDRIYLGSTAGTLYALRANGGRIWGYDARGAIESRPALDIPKDELYVGTEQAVMHALTASSGDVRWRVPTGGPIRNEPLLTDDAVYVVGDTDIVTAHARRDGEILWTYKRDAPEGYSITGHAGLAMAEGRLVTAFTDGMVVALDPADGTVVWERDTSLEVESGAGGRPTFVDVDTTPLVVGETVYVASFAGGLYQLDAGSGTVLHHDDALTGVVGLARAGDRLVASSADDGVVCMALEGHARLWSHPIERGAASEPVVAGPNVLVAVSQGPFLALSLEGGDEISRFEAGYGFTATASVHDGVGFVLANGGSVYAFRY